MTTTSNQAAHVDERLGLLGRKVGMMRIFTDDGDAIPVTVLDVSNNRVTQVKTAATDGYAALQVVFGDKKASRVTKPEAGHLAKAGVVAGEIMQEFRVAADTSPPSTSRARRCRSACSPSASCVDVQGTTIGKGFTGTIKRHHFSSQRASHGNSRSHNVPGSISMAQDPGRVFPGKKMSGQLGNVTAHDAEPRHRPHRRSAPAAARPRRGPRREERPRGRAPGREGAAEGRRQDCREGSRTDATRTPERTGPGDLEGRRARHRVRAATTTKRWCTRSSSPSRPTRASARAPSSTAAMVKHSTKKPWRQKGTGRARAGMTSSPLWRGGGRIFPNSPDENFTQKVNKKMYRAGMAAILSQLAREGRLAVVDSLTVDSPKTKRLAQKFKSMGLDSVLVITDQMADNLILASRNLANVLIVEPRYADPLVARALQEGARHQGRDGATEGDAGMSTAPDKSKAKAAKAAPKVTAKSKAKAGCSEPKAAAAAAEAGQGREEPSRRSQRRSRRVARSAHAESRLAQVLVAPIVSEKATMAAEKHNQVLFKVLRDATKPEIKAAVELMFKVDVESVSDRPAQGQDQALRPSSIGRRDHVKKAYVCAEAAGQELNFSGEAA